MTMTDRSGHLPEGVRLDPVTIRGRLRMLAAERRATIRSGAGAAA